MASSGSLWWRRCLSCCLLWLVSTTALFAQDMSEIVRTFETVDEATRRSYIRQIVKNYKEYEDVVATGRKTLDHRTTRAAWRVHDYINNEVKGLCSEVVSKTGTRQTKLVLVGSHGGGIGFSPGKSDLDFMPTGPDAGRFSNEFNAAFERKFGVKAESVRINMLDPTKVETWPARIKAIGNVEKYNTTGGNKWLERKLWNDNSRVWNVGASGKLDEVRFRNMYPEPPRLTAADAGGLFSDNTRFLNKVAEGATDLNSQILGQAKYHSRNAEAFELIKGKMSSQEARLVEIARSIEANKDPAFVKRQMQELARELGQEVDDVTRYYVKSMDALTDRMGREIVENHLQLIRNSKTPTLLTEELAGVVRNLPRKTIEDLNKHLKLSKDTRVTKVWTEAVEMAETIGGKRLMGNSMESMAKRMFNQSYEQLGPQQKALVRQSLEEVTSLKWNIFRATGQVSVLGLGAVMLYDAASSGYQEAGWDRAVGHASGRFLIELMQAGCPAIAIAEIVGRLTAFGVGLGIEAYKDSQLDALYQAYKADPDRLDDFLHYGAVKRLSNGALRQFFFDMRAKHPGITDEQITDRLRQWFIRRKQMDDESNELDRWVHLIESMLNLKSLSLVPGGLDIENDRLKNSDSEEYLRRIYHLRDVYQRLLQQLLADEIPFADREALRLLQAYLRGPDEFQKALKSLYDMYRTAPPEHWVARGRRWRVKAATGTKITRTQPDQSQIVKLGLLTTVQGEWKEKIETRDPADVYGPFDVGGPGKLAAEITGTPDAPNRWSLGNWNSTMTIVFEPLVGQQFGPGQTVLTLSGGPGKNKLKGTGIWPGAGRLTVYCGPSGGSAPLSGGQHAQAYSGKVSVIEAMTQDQAVAAGNKLFAGDQLKNDVNSQCLLMTPGSALWMGPNSDATLELASDNEGAPSRWRLDSGRIRVVDAKSNRSANVASTSLGSEWTLQLKGLTDDAPARRFSVLPLGTEFELDHQGTFAIVRVFEGQVAVEKEDGQFVEVNAGQQLQLPDETPVDIKASPSHPSWQGLEFGAWLTDQEPAPYGVRKAIISPTAFAIDDPTVSDGFRDIVSDIVGDVTDAAPEAAVPDATPTDDPRVSASEVPDDQDTALSSQLAADWIWQDPQSDVTKEIIDDEILTVTVPSGNEFWAHDQSAPRLLTKITGDFIMQCQLQIETDATELAISEWMLYAPGSQLGMLGKQVMDGPASDYRLLGGGWQRRQGKDLIPRFQRKLEQSAPVSTKWVHLRLMRCGDVYTSDWSMDGEAWNLSTREIIPSESTVWAGLSMKRVAHDRLHNAAAIMRIRDLQVDSRPRGSLSPPQWYVAAFDGDANPTSDRAIELQLDGSKLGSVWAWNPQRLTGDIDLTVRVDADPTDHQPGCNRSILVWLDAMTETNRFYGGWNEHDSFQGRRFTAHVQDGPNWKEYEFLKDPKVGGWLRLTRRGNAYTAAVWREGTWMEINRTWTGSTVPLHVGYSLGNEERTTTPRAVSAKFTVERLLTGDAATQAPPWIPPQSSVFDVVTAPADIKWPPNARITAWAAPFGLGRMLFDDSGTPFVLSSDMKRSKLLKIGPDDLVSTAIDSEALIGVNMKGAAWDGEDLLITVDGYHLGGNPLYGLYRVRPDGSFAPHAIQPQGGDMGDLISRPGGSWVYSEFTRDNVFEFRAEDREAVALLTEDQRPPGIVQLACAADGTLYLRNQAGDYPFGGASAVFRIENGKTQLVYQAPEGRLVTAVDVSPGGGFQAGLYVALDDGRVLQIPESGSETTIVTGLANAAQIRFSPRGSLWITAGKDGQSLFRIELPVDPALAGGTTSSTTSVPVNSTPSTPIQMVPSPGSGAESGTTSLKLWGFVTGPLPPAAAESLSLAGIKGVVVRQVDANSPASNGKLRVGDILIKANDMLIETDSALEEKLSKHPVGDDLTVEVLRMGVNHRLVLSASESSPLPPEMTKPLADPPVVTTPTITAPTTAVPPTIKIPSTTLSGTVRPKSHYGRKDVTPWIGIGATSAGTPKAVSMGIETPIGAVVTEMEANAPVVRAGLRPGDVIVDFNGQEISNYEDVECAILSVAPDSQPKVTFIRGDRRYVATLSVTRGRPNRETYLDYRHPSGAYTLTLPASWKVTRSITSAKVDVNAHDLLVSLEGNYRMHCYLFTKQVVDSNAALADFEQISRRDLGSEARVYRVKNALIPMSVAAIPYGSNPRVMLYRIAFVKGTTFSVIDSFAPVLSDPSDLTGALHTILGSMH